MTYMCLLGATETTFHSSEKWKILTVNGICLFWQLHGIWGMVPPPMRSQELQKLWPWNFYQILVSTRRHEIKKIFDRTCLVCKLQTKIPKDPIFGNATSRHANLTKFCRIVAIDVRNESWKFQIDISKIGYLTEQSVECRKKLICKMQKGI